jgi:hypothetical protein
VPDRVVAVLLVIVLTVLAIASVAGHGPLAGRELFPLTEGHGVNIGDLFVVGAWAVGVACCWRVWRRGED